MNNAFGFLIFGVFAIVVDAQLPNNMYYLVNHTISQNNIRIRYSEIQVNATEHRFDHFIESVRHNNEMVERTISDYTSDITVLGFLNKTNQNCVVKFANIPEVRKWTVSVNICANRGDQNFSGSFTMARSQIAKMKNYNLNIYKGTQICEPKYFTHSPELIKCINQSINENNPLIDTALKIVQRQLQDAFDTFDIISRTAFECAYNIQLDLGRTIKNNLENIRLCQLGLIN